MIPADYNERVYAGWLGKCIGVRFGAPLEGWTYQEIRDNLGELTGYVAEDRGKLFKPDDDTAAPMIFIRALQDYGASASLSAAQLGETWLNYMGDQHGTLWWGGYGISTEHTAYLNLASGISAPRSGAIAQNGAALAEQIGGQIFSDIWGLVAPDQPALAADLAERAASVSHDGNGIYGGRFIAALVSAAFRESDPRRLIDIGLAQIPQDSEYARVVRAMIAFHAENPGDWHAAYAYLNANFGYDRYPGMVHIIPNTGVVVIGLLYGGGDFSRTLQITNMAGWDTDCNVGNVGAILGVAVGLDGIAPHWREPVNDLLITANLIGVRNILTIPQCADLFCALGRQLAGESAPERRPRYHFAYRGATSNFLAEGDKVRPIHQSQTGIDGVPALRTSIRKLNKKGELRIFTRTFYRPSELSGNYYGAVFSPLIYPGQRLQARVFLPADAPDTLRAGLYVRDAYGVTVHQGETVTLTPGHWATLDFTIPALTDACLDAAGLVLRNLGEVWETGAFYLAWLDWSGADNPPAYVTTFAHDRNVSGSASQWTRLRGYWRLEDGGYHGSGPGEIETYTGDIDWTDYAFSAHITPLIGAQHHISVRVQGGQRGYAFGLSAEGVTLYKKSAGQYAALTSAPFAWSVGQTYRLRVSVKGARLSARVESADGTAQTLTYEDGDAPYLNGLVGLSAWGGGHLRCTQIQLAPAATDGD
ncbi:MAG TPA: ADP-ribosylglycohydrolase family protein [Aggregatilineales bacterium]|nr:ADP-ribosylglycohydrolase family protein [Aggregatilineales bacterium]